MCREVYWRPEDWCAPRRNWSTATLNHKRCCQKSYTNYRMLFSVINTVRFIDKHCLETGQLKDRRLKRPNGLEAYCWQTLFQPFFSWGSWPNHFCLPSVDSKMDEQVTKYSGSFSTFRDASSRYWVVSILLSYTVWPSSGFRRSHL